VNKSQLSTGCCLVKLCSCFGQLCNVQLLALLERCCAAFQMEEQGSRSHKQHARLPGCKQGREASCRLLAGKVGTVANYNLHT
jgi:hypothetical protein